MPNLVSMTRPRLQILGKTQTGYFRFPDFWSIPFKIKYHTSRTGYDIDTKLGPVTKLDKRKQLPKYSTMMSCRKIVTSSLFFGFLANLEQSGGRIPNTKPAKVTFQLIVTFCLRKTENRTIKSITQLSHYCFE